MSLKIKGKLYKICVQRVLVYASETWAMKIEDEQRLERAENAMIRWMCGVTLRDKVCNEGIEGTPRHSKCHGCGEKG